jgi:hypothetical protein
MRRAPRKGWLCIDPGITTGWALLDEHGELLGTSVWGTAELKTSLDAVIRTANLAGMTLKVVIERMPPGSLGMLEQKLAAVRRDIDSVIRDTYELPIHEVLPGTWKPSRIARTTTFPSSWQGTPLMVHQKDAIKMGRYFIDAQP